MGFSSPLDLTNSRPLEHATAQLPESKLLGLELIRFCCALAILFWHYRHFYGIAGAPPFIQPAQPLHGLFAPLYDYGLFGVQLFWGISGFIFFWKYGEAIAARAVSGARFFWLRLSRLYPLHLVTLLLVAMLQPIHAAITGYPFVYQANGPLEFVAQLFMATHWGGPAPDSFNGPIWSVSAEVAVYALFFLLVRQFGAGWRAIGVAIAAALLGQAAGVTSPVLFCASYFFVGGAAARLYIDARSAGRSTALWCGALLLLVLGSGYVSLADVPLNQQSLNFLILVGMPAVLIVGTRDFRLFDRCSGLIQTAGNLTYSTYLIHFPLQLAVAIGCAAVGFVLPVQSPLFLAAYLATTFVAGRWLFVRLERPAQSWIRRAALKPRIASALS
jgi:peptidoglycan/LPS O-acetylase OafA/YrhL